MPQRITSPEENINTPAFYDEKFDGKLGAYDMERLEKLAGHFSGGRYLDVGCFDSIMPALLAERYPTADIYAVDYAPKMIEFLAKRFPKVYYLCFDLMKDAWPMTGQFDYIVAGEIIEHMEDPAAFVDRLMYRLKPGGWLAISTPFEENHRDIGGKAHLWRWTVQDVKDLLKTEEVEVLQEQTNKTILAWKQKA